MQKERIDKLIASQGMLSRTDAAKIIKSGKVRINGSVIKSTSFKADPAADTIEINGEKFAYQKFIYIMMNKPQGVVSASRDPKEKTVVDLVPPEMKRQDLFPAGRLDKDTTGFVLITDDGAFAHYILSPRHHIDKTYLATTDSLIEESYLEQMRSGMQSGDEVFLPAQIELHENSDSPVYKITLHEGKYHQIKRMIGATNAELLALKRISMGALPLDDSLLPGECKVLSDEEVKLISP